MSLLSARQRAANKQNAQHSTGPRTAEGKFKVSHNAYKYGIRESELYSDEKKEEYSQFAEALIQEHQPQTPTEQVAVANLISYAWRLQRIRRIEADRFEANLEKVKANDVLRGGRHASRAFFLLDAKDFNFICRYEAAMQRGFNQTLKQLQTLRKDRRQEDAPTATTFTVHEQTQDPAPPQPEYASPHADLRVVHHLPPLTRRNITRIEHEDDVRQACEERVERVPLFDTVPYLMHPSPNPFYYAGS